MSQRSLARWSDHYRSCANLKGEGQQVLGLCANPVSVVSKLTASVSDIFVKYVSVGGGAGAAGPGLMGEVVVCLWDNDAVVCCLLEANGT